MNSSLASTYRTHTVHHFSWLAIETGHTAFAQALLQAISQLSGPKILVIDGFIGVPWSDFISRLRAALTTSVSEIRWFTTETCLRPASELEVLLAPSLTQDPVFGRLFRGDLQDFWMPEQLASLQEQLTAGADESLTIVSGFGASCVTDYGVHVYIDVPKDRCQQLAGQKAICNLGAEEPEFFGAMYKRFYFVDWPVLNQVKRADSA